MGDLNEFEDGYKYEIEATLAWPFGRCDLSVVTRSDISVELNSSDFIPTREYVLNTKNMDGIRIYQILICNC